MAPLVHVLGKIAASIALTLQSDKFDTATADQKHGTVALFLVTSREGDELYSNNPFSLKKCLNAFLKRATHDTWFIIVMRSIK